MKIFAVLIVGFVLGLFAPEIQHFHFLKHISVDPLAIAMIALVAWGISKARAKRMAQRNGGRA